MNRCLPSTKAFASLWRSALFAAFIAGGSLQVRADLITNGGFETGTFSGWTNNPVSFPQFVVNSPVHSGSFAAEIAGFSNNPDTLTQTILTSAGQTYDLSFWRSVTGSLGVGQTQLLTVSWDGVPVLADLNPGPQPYQPFSVNVVGTGSDTLLFTCGNDPGLTYVDDVSLVPTLPVPEPQTFSIIALFGGLLPLHILRRRWAKKVSSPESI